MHQFKQKGFSLIELMIAVALFAILAAFAIPSYKQMIQNGKIRTAAASIQNGLQLARAEAVSRNVKVQFDLRGTNSAWTVCKSPVAAGSCPTTDDATTIESSPDDADSNASVTGTGPYVFNGFGVMISPTPVAPKTNLEIDIANSETNQVKLKILIGVGGSIKSCDPTLDAAGTDLRRCSA